MAPRRPWVRRQVPAAHAFSVSRALSKGSVRPLRLGRCRPGEWLDMCEAEAGHANDLGDELNIFLAWKSRRGCSVGAGMRVFNQVQNLLLCQRLRLHHPARSARNVKGLLHHKCSSQQWPVVPLLFVGCLPAMRSLLCAAACLSLSSGGISLGRNMST